MGEIDDRQSGRIPVQDGPDHARELVRGAVVGQEIDCRRRRRGGRSGRGTHHRISPGRPFAVVLCRYQPFSVNPSRAQPALVYCWARYRFRSSSRIRNDLPIRTAGSDPVLISRYTVIFDTRSVAATSVTVRNRESACSSIGDRPSSACGDCTPLWLVGKVGNLLTARDHPRQVRALPPLWPPAGRTTWCWPWWSTTRGMCHWIP